MARLRHEDGRLRLFVDDQEVAVLKVIDYSARSDMQIESVKYMGDSLPTKDATDNGWNVSFTCELPNGFGDPNDLFEPYCAAVNARNGAGCIRAMHTYKVPGESNRRGYRYDGLQVNIDVRSSDKRAMSFAFTAEAESRERVQ